MIKLDHLTIAVRDYRAARDWYVQMLGLRQEFEIPGYAAALQDDAGFTLFVEQIVSDTKNAEPSCVLYFQVENVEAKHRQLARDQVQFVHGPEKQFWEYGAELKDLDGYRLRLWDEKTMNQSADP